MADMKQRCQTIAETDPDIVVSVHQNSYHQEAISGGQVFYYKGSEKGKKLAEKYRKGLIMFLVKNTRLAKANDNYYLLLHVKCPIVIVECGFLSNWSESKMLNSEDYQDRGGMDDTYGNYGVFKPAVDCLYQRKTVPGIFS